MEPLLSFWQCLCVVVILSLSPQDGAFFPALLLSMGRSRAWQILFFLCTVKSQSAAKTGMFSFRFAESVSSLHAGGTGTSA